MISRNECSNEVVIVIMIPFLIISGNKIRTVLPLKAALIKVELTVKSITFTALLQLWIF